VVLLPAGGRLIVAAPVEGGSTTVSEFFGGESGGLLIVRLIVAAPTSLTVNSRPQAGQFGGASFRSSKEWPQLGQVRMIRLVSSAECVF
jgi:hypothetical protein